MRAGPRRSPDPAGEEGRADEANAKADTLAAALAESKSKARRKGKALRRSIVSGEARLLEIRTKATSSGASSSATTYTEDEGASWGT